MKQLEIAVVACIQVWLGERNLPEPVVAGGYARNVAYGIDPSDVDLVVPMGPDWNDADVFHHTEALAYELRVAFTMCRVDVAQAYGSSNGDFNERIYTLVQIHGPNGEEVDVMFHREPTIEAVIRSHDCNLNQVYMDGGTPVWLEAQPNVAFLLKPLYPARIKRLREVAEQCGVFIDEASFEVNTIDPDIGDAKESIASDWSDDSIPF